MSLPLLLEIGSEEIPDWMIPPALEQLRSLFTELMNQGRIGVGSILVDATPRRLVLRAREVAARQPDTTEQMTGPAKNAPPAAVAGFARKQGVSPEDLELVATPRGEYYSSVRKIPGRATRDILAQALPDLRGTLQIVAGADELQRLQRRRHRHGGKPERARHED